MVAVGISTDFTVIAELPPVSLISRRLNLVGSCVGTPKNVEEALGFAACGLPRPISTFGILNYVNDLLTKMNREKVAGRPVIKISTKAVELRRIPEE